MGRTCARSPGSPGSARNLHLRSHCSVCMCTACCPQYGPSGATQRVPLLLRPRCEPSCPSSQTQSTCRMAKRRPKQPHRCSQILNQNQISREGILYKEMGRTCARSGATQRVPLLLRSRCEPSCPSCQTQSTCRMAKRRPNEPFHCSKILN